MSIRSRRDLMPWLVRALWAVLPFTVGPVLADALAQTSYPVRTLSSVGLWAGWGLGMLATLLPHPVSLTTLRILAPAGAALATWSAAQDHPSPVAIGWTLVSAAWVFSPAFGEWCVNGPAYPNERRHLLRSPGPLIGGGVALVFAWDVAVAGLCSGPLLLAARQWAAGAVLTVLGWGIAAVFLRSLHGLSRRWLVYVPAGVVIHDPVALRDPVLFPRRVVASLGPVTDADSGVIDLTRRALGFALELRLREPVKLTLMKPGRRLGVEAEAAAVVVTPTRPGEVLGEARARRLPVISQT